MSDTIYVVLNFFVFVFKTGSLLQCSSVCPGAFYVDQASLELTEIHLYLPSECWDKECAPPTMTLLSCCEMRVTCSLLCPETHHIVMVT